MLLSAHLYPPAGPGHFPTPPGKRAPIPLRSRRLLCSEGRSSRPLLAGAAASQRARALKVSSNRFPCFSFSCCCSARRGGPEYFRYFPLPSSWAQSFLTTRLPAEATAGFSGGNGAPLLQATSTGSCLPSPPCKCREDSTDLNIPRVDGVGLDIQPRRECGRANQPGTAPANSTHRSRASLEIPQCFSPKMEEED
ncbi:high mobility group protein B1 isoform X2 [Sus scrofa]|uniref:high mobility group protein B1 isoform X2 n=1 Tax=Sus scrofa TaxID=9823 RepID=UPI000A2B85E7|nr:high mobility group protein B1 isoform X2 [Sus scrofa]